MKTRPHVHMCLFREEIFLENNAGSRKQFLMNYLVWPLGKGNILDGNDLLMRRF